MSVRQSIKREGEIFYALNTGSHYSLSVNYSTDPYINPCISSILQLTKNVMATNFKVFAICGNVGTVQVEDDEATISIFDNSGYACVNFCNVENDFKHKFSPGNFRIHGVFYFKRMAVDTDESCSSNDIMEMVVANIDYPECQIVSISDQEMENFNESISSIPSSNFLYSTNFSFSSVDRE